MVGVHNKRTGTTTLRAAPLHLLTHQVKALKNIKPAPVSAKQLMEARAALGETFGTKKAKANIRARERNKVDVSAMEGVADHLQDRIEKSTVALPTQGESRPYFCALSRPNIVSEEATETANSTRLIPPHNEDAEVPGDVYQLHDIIPEAEMKAISTSALTSANGTWERMALLPFRRSNWINQHMNILFAASLLDKKALCVSRPS